MIIEKDIPKSIFSKIKVKCKCDLCNLTFSRRFESVAKKDKIHCRRCSYKENGKMAKGKKRTPEQLKILSKAQKERHAKQHPKFTLICQYCQKEFVVPYRQRNRMYCGKACQVKSIVHTDIRQTSECLICKKEFKHYGQRVVCGRRCTAKYLSVSRIGENNPAHKNSKRETRICLNCNKQFEFTRSGMRSGQNRVFCSLACSHKIDLKNSPLTGLKHPYPLGWKQAKKEVKKRDDFTCQICGEKETNGEGYHVHHIDYDKNNLDMDNLVTLCRCCHNMTHHGRTFWQIIFAALLSGSKIVRKPWGAEIHIVNHGEYCLKYLIFFKNRQFSFHVHFLKKELWHCVYGKLECVLGAEFKSYSDYFIFKAGDKMELKPKVIHQLQAIRNSIIVEVSTKDLPEDSIRLVEGIND